MSIKASEKYVVRNSFPKFRLLKNLTEAQFLIIQSPFDYRFHQFVCVCVCVYARLLMAKNNSLSTKAFYGAHLNRDRLPEPFLMVLGLGTINSALDRVFFKVRGSEVFWSPSVFLCSFKRMPKMN